MTYYKEVAKQCLAELEGMLTARKLKVNIASTDCCTTANCDRVRIGQVITNLLSNAIKFSPRESEIRLVISNDFLTTEDNSPLPAVRFAVQDQGVGIPNEELDTVFDKFIQSSKTKAGGTGLGLAISKEIIEAHGGKILADKDYKEGAGFYFVIPRDGSISIDSQPTDFLDKTQDLA